MFALLTGTDSLSRSYKSKAFTAKSHSLASGHSSLTLTPHTLPPLGLASASIRAAGPAAEYNSDSAESLVEVPAKGESPRTLDYPDPAESPHHSHRNYAYSSDVREGLTGFHNPYYVDDGAGHDHWLSRQQDAHRTRVPPIDLSSFHSSDSENNNNDQGDYQRAKLKRKAKVKVKSRNRPKKGAVEA